MKTISLKSVKIYKYKSYETAQTFEVGPKITVLVGKNESGKTAALEAVAKTRYFTDDKKFRFDPVHDYPRKAKKQYDKSGIVEPAVTCVYSISTELLKNISDDVGAGTLAFKEISLTHKYDNSSVVESGVPIKLESFLKFKGAAYGVIGTNELAELLSIKDSVTLASLSATLQQRQNQSQQVENASAQASGAAPKTIGQTNLQRCLSALSKYFEVKPGTNWSPVEYYVYFTWIQPNLPKFLYYDEYYALPSRIDISKLQSNALDSDELKTSKALFELADININDLISASSFEQYIAELEATSNLITQELFKYWTTNKELLVRFAIDKQFVGNQPQSTLDIRVENRKHMMSLPLGNRSKGFNWFFSFIVWFSKIQEDKKSNYVLLLDEPGLNLHASAQADLLKYFDDLSSSYQVIYTTHSPFMVDSDKLADVRTVFDNITGSEISTSIQQRDTDTLFPLQAALGYDIAQNLFVSKNNLLVEGVSDLVYLTILSGILEGSNRVGLKDGITVVPVGGLDKVASFISLLRGSRLNIVCLLDTFTDQSGRQRVDDLVKHKIIKEKQIHFFDEFSGLKGGESDIEDLFTKAEYLKMFIAAFPEHAKIQIGDVANADDRILPQIATFIARPRFNHYRVANYLAQAGAKAKDFDPTTLDRFERMFKTVNALF